MANSKNIVERGIDILRKDGLGAFVHRTANYLKDHEQVVLIEEKRKQLERLGFDNKFTRRLYYQCRNARA